MKVSPTAMLVILDGWGCREDNKANAVRLARTPNFDRLWETCPHSHLVTHGREVGLPDGQMGNSEVGHLTIGSGRVVLQNLPRISDAAESGELSEQLDRSGVLDALLSNGGTLHVVGLASTGGVHSHIDHALAIVNAAAAMGVPVALHAISDGRDRPPKEAEVELRRLEDKLPSSARIATICGRYFAMDRDNRWDRTKKACDALVDAVGDKFDSVEAAVRTNYEQGHTDEFFEPAIIGGFSGMKDGDGALFFNFRTDRVKQLCHAMIDETFNSFRRHRRVRFAQAISMTEYGGALTGAMHVLFQAVPIDSTLGETVSKAGLTQARLAETEKFPHVTYFLNGGREEPFAGEVRIMVPSPTVATYDLKPEMSAPELTEKAIEAIASERHDLIILNYANPDMVGHTGNLQAAIRAVEAVDRELGRLHNALVKRGGALLVIADHGNCEVMVDSDTGNAHTAHTTSPVPCVLAGAGQDALRDGALSDIAPTLLDLLGLAKPLEMTGSTLRS